MLVFLGKLFILFYFFVFMVVFCFNDDVSVSDINFVLRLSDEVFGLDKDPSQYNPSLNEFLEFHKNFPFSFCVFRKDNKIVGFVTAVPCSFPLMGGFLSGEISESVLVNSAQQELKKSSFDALYLMGAYIAEDYRRQGFVKDAFSKIISFYKNENENLFLFAWPLSSAGLALCNSLADEFVLKFKFRT